MVQIEGKYLLESNERFVEYLKSLGIPEDNALYADKLRPTVDVKVNGETYTITSDSGVKNTNIEFTIGVEFDDVMPTEHTLRSVATINGSVITVKSKLSDLGVEGSRTYEFSDSGLTISYTCNRFDGTAKRTYKRV